MREANVVMEDTILSLFPLYKGEMVPPCSFGILLLQGYHVLTILLVGGLFVHPYYDPQDELSDLASSLCTPSYVLP